MICEALWQDGIGRYRYKAWNEFDMSNEQPTPLPGTSQSKMAAVPQDADSFQRCQFEILKVCHARNDRS